MLKRSPLEVSTILVAVVILGYLGLPAAASATATALTPSESTQMAIAAMQNETKDFGQLPKAGERGPSYTISVPTSAYNSLPGQTDSTPFITASGSTTRHGVLAANFLPIGTRVTIPEIYGDQVFIVEDRMNSRYTYRVDIWMEHLSDARQFGVKTVTMNIYK